MALEDIEKLKEKVEKDPNSKLFVPLADEYRKRGMLDDAIATLLRGLETQPGYMSARVSLGKVYLEKNMMREAREEFEKVVSAIPDNLFAHKKLAEIYRDSGDRERAISAYKTVLRLNPLDEDSVANLDALQKGPVISESVTRETEVTLEGPSEEMPAEKPVVSPDDEGKTEVAEEAKETEEEGKLEGIEGVEEIEGIEGIEEVSEIVIEEATEEKGSTDLPEMIQPADEFEEFKKSVAARGEEEEELVAEEVISEEEMEEAEVETAGYINLFKDIGKATPSSPEEKVEQVKPATALVDAERLISEGNYSQAMKTYREALSIDPQNKIILQKIEELKMLLKILGKGQDEVIAKLEAFREEIKKRKDEFFRSA